MGQHFIKIPIGRDPVTCVGCDKADPYGPRTHPFWFCRVYKQQLGRGVPLRCKQCIQDEVRHE